MKLTIHEPLNNQQYSISINVPRDCSVFKFLFVL